MPQLVNLRSAAHPELLGLLRHLPEEQLTSLQRLREGKGGHCPTKMPFLLAAQARTSRKLIHQTLPREKPQTLLEGNVKNFESHRNFHSRPPKCYKAQIEGAGLAKKWRRWKAMWAAGWDRLGER